MFHTTKALVLREVRYKEADRILTLLSETDGKLTAKARGALRKNSRTGAATQQMTYAEMTLFGNRGKWTVNEASLIEPFTGLRSDIQAFALGSYFSECLEAFSMEDEPDAELLQLGLNSLYALSRRLADIRLIKAAFEFRLMSIAGYRPDINACSECGKTEPEKPVLLLESGALCCRDCRRGSGADWEKLDEESLRALRHIINAPPKKLLSLSLAGNSLDLLSAAAERYLLTHAERGFASLSYWKNLRN